MAHLFDLHDGALYVWRDAGARGRTLVHIDAHHDLDAPADDTINIGNFVRVAIHDGIVARMFWVVPDPMWRDERTRRWLVGELREAGADVRFEAGDAIDAVLDGCRVLTTTLESLPSFDEPVLLDIDVDFLLMAERHAETSLRPLDVPWSWPSALASRIHDRGMTSDLVTIATSVTGGFVPIRWQHLGREIAIRFDNSFDRARLDSSSEVPAAAAHFRDAELLLASGDVGAAREAFGRARALDPTYRHPFRTRGPWFIAERRWREAIDAYREALALDPDDPHAMLGLAIAMLNESRPGDALALARSSLSAVDTIEGWRTAARASAALGDRDSAIAAYRRAIAAALRGASPLIGPWSSNPERRLADPSHWQDHAELAELLASAGDTDGALAHRRIADRAVRAGRLVGS